MARHGKQETETETRETRHFKVSQAREFKNGNVSFTMESPEGIKVYRCTLIAKEEDDGKDKSWVSFPSYKGTDDKYYNYVWTKLTDAETADIIDQIDKLLD